MIRQQPSPTKLAIMQARAKHKYIARKDVANLDIRIEYEDDNFTYISSEYPHKVLNKDIEEIKRPITIHYNKNAQPIAESRQKEVFS